MGLSKLPDVPAKWPKFFRNWVENKLLPWLDSQQIVESGDVSLHQTDHGRVPTVHFPGGGSKIPRHALELYDASNADDGARVGITFGTVAGLVPSGAGALAPADFVVPVSGTGVIYAAVAISDIETLGIPESVDFYAGSVTPDNTLGELYLTVGYYSVVSVSPPRVNVGSALAGSQAMTIVFAGPATAYPYWAAL
jgi:hypothetical protein